MKTNILITMLSAITTCLYDMLRCTARVACVTLLLAGTMFASALASAQEIVYVDAENGLPTGDGESWTTAFKFLQDGIAAAAAHNPTQLDPVEIWVAQGEYRPDQSSIHESCGEGPPGPNCCPPWGNCDEMATFELLDNVGIFGGFDGTETLRSERRPLENITILSGPAHTIVTSNGNNGTARLDGFHIAYGEFGLNLSQSDAIIANCTFRDNDRDGAVAAYGEPHFINCVFKRNGLYGTFGALHLFASNATVLELGVSRAKQLLRPGVIANALAQRFASVLLSFLHAHQPHHVLDAHVLGPFHGRDHGGARHYGDAAIPAPRDRPLAVHSAPRAGHALRQCL